jgi:hypothetical protein
MDWKSKMSWYVQYLITNRYTVKSKLQSGEGYVFDQDTESFEGIIYNDLEMDIYNDILLMEKKIDDLHSKGVLTEEDMYIIERMSYDTTITSLAKELKITRASALRRFREISFIVAFHLKGYFTNTGFLKMLKEEYNISDSRIEQLKNMFEESSRINKKGIK